MPTLTPTPTYSSTDFRSLRGRERLQANEEYRLHGTGPRKAFEDRQEREREFQRMIAPGGSLADLASIDLTALAV